MDENKNIPENENNEIINEDFSFDENVSFGTDEEINVVEKKEENKKVKLPFIIVICVLITALVAGIIIYAVKDKTKPLTDEEISSDEDSGNLSMNDILAEMNTDEEYLSWRDQILADSTTQLSNNVGSQSPNEIVEPSTSGSQTTPEKPTANTQQTANVEAHIKAFFNKKYHMKGAMYDNKGVGDPFSISQDGEDLEAMGNLDGFEIAMMRLDGVVYFKRPVLRQYVILTDSLMDFMGFDKDFFEFDFGNVDYEEMKKHLDSVYDVSINDTPGVCYYYKSEKQQFKFFAQDGNLKQIEIYDNTGKLTSQMMISYFSSSIPADHLTLKGYTETTFGTFFGDVFEEEMQ